MAFIHPGVLSRKRVIAESFVQYATVNQHFNYRPKFAYVLASATD